MNTGYFVLNDTGGSFNDPEQQTGLHGRKPAELKRTERVRIAARHGHIKEISRKEYVGLMKELGHENELKMETEKRKEEREKEEDGPSGQEEDPSSEKEEDGTMTKKDVEKLVKTAGKAEVIQKNDDGDYEFGETALGSSVKEVIETVHKDPELQQELKGAVEKEEN